MNGQAHKKGSLIHNSLSVTGPEDQIERVHMLVSGPARAPGREVALDFASILRPPEDIKDGNPDVRRLWYLMEWGTPENARHAVVRRTPGRLAIIFESEIQPPLPLIVRLSRMFPGLIFELAWSSETVDALNTILLRRGLLEFRKSPEDSGSELPGHYTLLPFRLQIEMQKHVTLVRIDDIRNRKSGHNGAPGPAAAVYGGIYDLLRKAPGYGLLDFQRVYCLASTVLADMDQVGPDGHDHLPPAGRGWSELAEDGVHEFQRILRDLVLRREQRFGDRELPPEHGLQKIACQILPDRLRVFARRVVPCVYHIVLEADPDEGSFSVGLTLEDEMEARLRGDSGNPEGQGVGPHFTQVFDRHAIRIRSRARVRPVTGVTAALMRGEFQLRLPITPGGQK